MATPVFCCGGECGILAATAHWTATGAASISTTTFRSGLRSFRANSAGTAAYVQMNFAPSPAAGRFYIYFASLPNADVYVANIGANGSLGIYFKLSDSKLYGVNAAALSASGFTVTTNTWYKIEWKWVQATSFNVNIDGTELGPVTPSSATLSTALPAFGVVSDTITADVFYDDILISSASNDYPLGPGYVISYIPNADGTHNVAGANDFERSATGTDIIVGTTTAFQLVDDRPLKSGAPDTEFINMILPVNATDYVELAFEDSIEIAAPRTIEVIAKVAQAGTGTGNMELRLNDNGTMGTIYTATTVAGIVNGKYVRAHFADPPSAASAWVIGGAGNGDFNNIKVRFGSPAVLDVNPDQYLVSIMIEAEFQPALPKALFDRPYGIIGKRQMQQLLAT